MTRIFSDELRRELLSDIYAMAANRAPR